MVTVSQSSGKIHNRKPSCPGRRRPVLFNAWWTRDAIWMPLPSVSRSRRMRHSRSALNTACWTVCGLTASIFWGRDSGRKSTYGRAAWRRRSPKCGNCTPNYRKNRIGLPWKSSTPTPAAWQPRSLWRNLPQRSRRTPGYWMRCWTPTTARLICSCRQSVGN